MEIQLPENMDISAGRHQLSIAVYPDQFRISIRPPEEEGQVFRFPIPEEKSATAFTVFRDTFFDHSFFSLPFRKTIVLNCTQIYAFVPNSLYEEKDKETYMHFLFTSFGGKILEQRLEQPAMTVLHAMPEEIYGFFQRSFPDAQLIHPAAVRIAWFQNKGQTLSGKRMLVNRQTDGVEIICFAHDKLLLCNYFPCSGTNDAVYFVLNCWQQVGFSQTNDFLYLNENQDLQEKLALYIRKLVPMELPDLDWYADC
jgi:hypothetical protein